MQLREHITISGSGASYNSDSNNYSYSNCCGNSSGSGGLIGCAIVGAISGSGASYNSDSNNYSNSNSNRYGNSSDRGGVIGCAIMGAYNDQWQWCQLH